MSLLAVRKKNADRLQGSIDFLLREKNVLSDFSFERKLIDDTVRLSWSRRHHTSIRHLWVTPVGYGPHAFSILGGSYRDHSLGGNVVPVEPEFDARRGGNLDYTIETFRHWLINLHPSWDAIPAFEVWQPGLKWS